MPPLFRPDIGSGPRKADYGANQRSLEFPNDPAGSDVVPTTRHATSKLPASLRSIHAQRRPSQANCDKLT
jgi:hypothetical protein